MTLALLCKHQLTLQRAVQTAGPNGEVLRNWQTLAAAIPAAVLTFRARADNALVRRGIGITHVILILYAAINGTFSRVWNRGAISVLMVRRWVVGSSSRHRSMV